MERSEQKIAAIRAYVSWYQIRYDITIGSPECQWSDLGACRQLIELLARCEYGVSYWLNLVDRTLDETYAFVVNEVRWMKPRDRSKLRNWAQPAWETDPEVLAIVDYVQHFRVHHSINLRAPRDLKTHDLDEPGQYLIGVLVHEPEYSSAWERLADGTYALHAAQYVADVLRPRLADYVRRSSRVAVA